MDFQRTAMSPYLKIALTGFAIAVVGVALGFSGTSINVSWLAQLGFFVVLFGVLIGIIGIFLGWLKEGRSAIRGSRKAAENIRDRCGKFLD